MSATSIREALENLGRLITEQPEKARAKNVAMRWTSTNGGFHVPRGGHGSNSDGKT